MRRDSWQLYDPITVLPDGGMPAMDGIIAYLDNPKKPTKIGVRLTGSSIGLGDHSGSVDGIDYFDCPLNSGLFVEPHQIEARTLSRIEQLRLKRELAAGQLDISKGGAGMLSEYMDSSGMSPTPAVERSSMIGGKPPSFPNHAQAIAPQEQPQSIALNGLSPTALARLSQLNPGGMTMASTAAAANPQPQAVEEEDEEMLVSDHEKEEEYEDAADEEYLKINREHISRLQQRKEEIKRRKLELQQQKSNGGNNGESSNDAPPPLTEEKEPVTTSSSQPLSAVVTPSKGGENGSSSAAAMMEEEEPTPSQPLSRLEQLKLKKRQLETVPATNTTATTTTTKPSTVNNLVAMAAAATPERQATQQGEGGSEQVPWPFPATSREVPVIGKSQLSPAVVLAVESQQRVQHADQPLSRLELLKLKKRQLEEGGPPVPVVPPAPKVENIVPQRPPPPAPATPNKTIQQPTPRPQVTSPMSPPPMAQGDDDQQQQAKPPILVLPEPMDRGAPMQNGGSPFPPPPPPTEITVQILNSSTKRVKELSLKISKDINLYTAVYDNSSVKQANVRKWGTSFVQQVKEKKSEIRCRVALLSNPPPEQANEPIKSMPMELSVDQLKVTTTDRLYNQYKDNFYPGRSKVQMLLRCQPMGSNGEEDNSKLVTDQDEEEEPAAAAAQIAVPVAAVPVAPAPPAPVTPPKEQPKKQQQHEAPPEHIDRSSITSIASQLVDVKHQLRIKVINERTRYFKDLLVETSHQINLYEAVYNNPAVKQAKVRKWNSSIVEQVRSGMAEIVCQICTIPNGKPEHLVKHGILAIDQLKECSTTELYTRYAMDHYDLENDKSLIQLVLKCQEIKTPIASNQAASKAPQNTLVTPTNLTDSLPPVTPQDEASRGNPVLETPPVVSRPIHPWESPTARASPTEASQSSLNSMERKPTNSPYAKAASAALPMHTTRTTFSDLLRHEQQQQAALTPNSFVTSPEPDVELGRIVEAPIVIHKTDTGVQTNVEMATLPTPPRDNRRQSPQRVQPMTFAEKLQEVDAYWWLAIIFILAAAFFAALFLGPVS